MPRLALLLALAACGGGGGGPSSPPTATLSGTLAYAVSECRDTNSGYFLRQSVQVRQGDRDPITVTDVPEIGNPVLRGACTLTSSYRFGGNSARRGAVQRLAVSADGATVAFELSDDFSFVARNFLPAKLKGIFVVRADGNGLRQLGPPSRQVSWVYPPGWYPFGENPSEECQVFSIDRLGANLRQLTHFREADHSDHGCDFGVPVGSGCASSLVGQDTGTQAVLFYSSCDPLGTNPRGGQIFAMRPDGLDLRQVTNTRGLVTETDGTVIGEFPGPAVFSGSTIRF